MKTVKEQFYQFIVELEYYKPRMWRRFVISSAARLQDFCYAVMEMFHCMGSHLHQIRVGKAPGAVFYVPDDEDEFEDFSGHISHPMADTKVRDLFKTEKDTAYLEYDFGDGWEFKITLEKKESEKKLDDGVFALALAGKGFGIIEDCGGAWGLMNICKALKDGGVSENFESREQMEEWLESALPCELEGLKGDAFDYFNIGYVNEQIEDIEELRGLYEPSDMD